VIGNLRSTGTWLSWSVMGSAEMLIKKDYKLTKLKGEIDDKDSEAFWKRVEAAVEIGVGE